MRLVHTHLKVVFTLLALGLAQLIFSQQKIVFNSVIKGQIINQHTGTLLVKTRKGIFGIDPETRLILWSKPELKKVDLSDYKEIPYTPIAIFSQKPLISSKAISNTLNSKGASKTMLHVITGKEFFDSNKNGFKAVNNTMIIPQKKGVLVDGIKKKDLVISLFDYETGEQLWETQGVDSPFFTNVKGIFFDDEKILLDAQQNIYWLKNKHLIKIDGDNGKILYEQDNVTSIAMNGSKDILFVFSNTLGIKKLGEDNGITALDTRTTAQIWEDPIQIWGNIFDTAIDGNSLVVITSKGFNVIDIEKGTKKWKRSEPLPLIKRIVPVEQGYLVVQDNFLVRINSEGEKAWDKKIRITNSFKESPVHILEEGRQALYITPSKANRVQVETGDKLWEKDIVLNSTGFVGRNLKLRESQFKIWNDTLNQLFPVYGNNSFYLFSRKSSVAPISIDTFNFKRSSPNLKIRKEGYLLFQQNQFYYYDTLGQLRYKKKYPYHDTGNVFSETFYWAKRGFGTYTSAMGFVGNQIAKTFNSVLVSTNLGPVSTVSSKVYGTYLTYRGSLEDVTELNQLDFDMFNLSTILYRINTGRKHEGQLLVVAPSDTVTEIIRLDIDSGEEETVKTFGHTYSNFVIDQVEQQIYFFNKKSLFIETLNE
ncbi:PQQ-binding-like beta-propeller repeat protein [Flagellimonas algicola]|uniref:Pyrrolo-quinoline quinone repeat domain-containing protein n=1 Tax=Flagellimonas algicola TaxID=2583815 RepID=A0ABY2WFR5_9FLAO|nr:PQQ-binding-like beta-propeller repeat protein [Allomuricauda algicola]TMU50391.1 hypothetical protein FGG15_19785 [Allomuricauda algicola]